jgi:heme A synthase
VSAALLHDRLSVTATFYALAMAVWAVVMAARGRGIDGGYLGAIVIGEVVLVVQAALGVWLMVVGGDSPARGIHLLYGTLAVLIWPFLMTYTRGGTSSREAVIFAAGSFFLWGLLLRAATTAVVA